MTTRTRAAKAKTVSFSAPLWVGPATESREKIEGARDDQRALRARQLERPISGSPWIVDQLNMMEVPFGTGGKVPCRQSPGVRGLRGHEGRPQDGERLQHEVRPLVRQDGGDDDVVV